MSTDIIRKTPELISYFILKKAKEHGIKHRNFSSGFQN